MTYTLRTGDVRAELASLAEAARKQAELNSQLTLAL